MPTAKAKIRHHRSVWWRGVFDPAAENLPAAQLVAERLRRKVETSAFSVASNAISTTISVGVAEADPSMNSIFDLIKLADKALYTAKESGRNRVCAA